MAQLAAYRAGSVFLQIVPSFRGVQEAIRDQVKRWGKDIHDGMSDNVDKGLRDGIKKSRDGAVRDAGDAGDEMGSNLGGRFRTALRNAVKDAGKDLGKEISPALDDIHSQLDALGEEIKVDLDPDQALARLAVLREQLNRLQAEDAEIEVRVNAAGAAAAIQRVEAMVKAAKPVIEAKVEVNQGAFERTLKQALRNAADQIEEVDITADISSAERQLAVLRAELLALADKKINVDIDEGAALGELAALITGLEALSEDDTVDVTARFNASQATASLLAFNELVSRVDGREVDVTTELHGDSDAGAAKARKSGESAGGAAASWRAFNGVLLTAIALGPLLVPVLAAITGGVLALAAAIPAAVIGIGVLAIAFKGVGAVVGDLTELETRGAQETAAMAATMRTAANSLRDAQEGLTSAQRSAAENIRSALLAQEQAQRSAAESIRSALLAQEEAERRLVDAQRDAIDAQEDLNDARKQAAQDLEDLQSALKRGVLDERQAEIDLFEAQMHAQRTAADPGATRLEREEADIALERARLALEDIRRENGRLKDEKADADKKGIEGSDLVTAAQERIRQALEAQIDAERALGEASRQVALARVDAERALGEASRRVDLARIESSEQVRDAQQRLSEAQLDYAEALQKTQVEGGAAARKLKEDLAALGPAGQAFAFFIFGLRDYWRQIRDTVQAGVLPGVQDAIEKLIDHYGPRLLEFMTSLSTTIGGLFALASDVFTNPTWDAFFTMLQENSGQWLTDFATIGLAVLTFLAGLATALAPFTDDLLTVITGIADSLAHWGAGLTEDEGFANFLAYVQDVGPEVWQLIQDIVTSILHLAEGLAPVAGILLDAFAGLFAWLAQLDPTAIAAIVLALVGLIGTFQVLAGAISLANGFLAIFDALELTAFGPILIAVAIIGALVAAFVIAYTASTTFREIIKDTFEVIGNVVGFAWDIIQDFASFLNDFFGPLVTEVWTALKDGWNDFFEAIKPGLEDLMEAWPDILTVLKFIGVAILGVIGIVIAAALLIGSVVVNVIANVVGPLFTFIGKMFSAVIQVLTGFIDFIAGVFTGDWSRAWDGIKKIFGGIWDGILAIVVGFWDLLWGVVSGIVEGVIDFFTFLWDTLVGHSIIPDLVNDIIDWFMSLDDRAIEIVSGWVEAVVGWFVDLGERAIQAASDLYNGVVGWFESLPGKIGEIFGNVVAAFSKQWDRLKQAAMVPVTFVVDTIINKGIIDTFNKIADFFQGDDAFHIPHIPWPPAGSDDGAGGPRPMAEGGAVGGRSPHKRADNIPAWLTAGEFVMPVDAVDYYGLEFMEMLRRRRYAGGGWVSPAPEGRLGLGFGNTYSGGRFHSGQDFPTAVGSPAVAAHDGVVVGMQSLLGSYGRHMILLHGDGLRTLYAHLNAFRASVGDHVAAGRRIGDTGNTGNSTGPHLHFEVRLPPGGYSDAVDPMKYLSGAGLGGDGQNPPWYKDPFGWLVDHIKEAITGPVEGLIGKVTDSPLGRLLVKVPLKVLDLAKNAVLGMFHQDHTVDQQYQLPLGNNEQVVRAVAATRDWADGAEWEALRTIVSRESGFNNNAQNPHSTAYGLFQFLDGTWASTGIAKTSDPYLQSVAGMEYIASRYGDPLGALAFHNAHGYYSSGGAVKQVPTSLYDTGGIVPPGLSGVLNRTGSNEHLAILTNEQALRLTSGPVGGDTWDIDIQGQQEPLLIVDEIMRQVRRERRRPRRTA